MDAKHRVLKQVFGYDQFRQGQEAVIDAILQGRDALGVMPTGAGKSICYQVPGLVFSGITLVVSPLISLMRDQVQSLRQAGVAGAFLNTSLTRAQYFKALENAMLGQYKIIYVAPERLLTDRFLEFACTAPIDLLAVDEAHCVSQWGQDFRPSYLDIPAFVQKLPHRPVVAAFTATATPRVKADIQVLLQLQQPAVVTTGFDRKNLYYEVQHPKDKKAALLDCMGKYKGQSGIIYCATRKNVEEVCAFLRASGLPATRYHAGLEPEERQQNQQAFLFDEAPIMVATNAFGMGIDKSNVRYVIHYNMPKDMESYYQEAGRAGRDGAPADCILLYSGQDVTTARFLIEKGRESEALDEQTARQMIARDMGRLRQMADYCQTGDCLRQTILHYFGEQAPDHCGNCSNCGGVFQQVDLTAQARRAVLCVQQMGQRFGYGVVSEVLRGAETGRVEEWGLARYQGYGALAGMTDRQVGDLLRLLVRRDFLVVKEGKYPILQLGPLATQLIGGQQQVLIRQRVEPGAQSQKHRQKAAPNPALFQRLRTLRAQLARRQGVPAFVVFSDATLQDMSGKAPATWEQMLEVSGVGQKKMEQYGTVFLDAIAQWRRETEE